MKLPKLSKRRWLTVSGVALAGIGVAWLGFESAAIGVNRSRNPEVALRYASGDAEALAGQADKLFQAAVTAGQIDPVKTPSLKRAAALAAESIRRQGVNPRALRVLGGLADMEHRAATAARLIELSERMSRRDSLTQLWLIEYAVQNNDIGGALRHYDVLLRAKPSMQEFLFARLLNALDEKNVRVGLAKFVTANNPWLPDFLSYAVRQDRSPLNVAQTIMLAGKMPDTPLLRNLSPELLRRFGERGEYGYARDYYRRVVAHGDGVLTHWDFSRQATNPDQGLFSWQVATVAGVNAAFERTGETATFHIILSQVKPAVLLSKAMMLPRGKYRIGVLRTSRPSEGQGAPLVWQLRCLSADAANANTANEAQGIVVVDCDAQIIELRLTDTLDRATAELSVLPPDVTKIPS